MTTEQTENRSDPTAHHVGVTVTDLDRAVAFYRDALGLDVLDRFSVSGEAFAEGVGVPGATGEFAHLDAGSARVELVAYDPEGDEAAAERVNQPGAKHLGLAVADLDGFYDELPPAVETVSEPQTTASGTKILFVRDPEGNLVEILEA
ncbi:VOC family protein [Halorussus gelatinilyticus]|uniref:VOC family protein n=1 Tax=Halorussus gelatinilyticus TaxID=2937524 RepID=A0A8U0IKX8_9EURY|nr:VOC family protein [Halorussus gelatinilyticus]UPW01281.1 VOC family protein [Halorussus gelatinilyticus]